MARIKLQVRDFITPGQRVHLAGIGGVSMSSLAAVLHSMGALYRAVIFLMGLRWSICDLWGYLSILATPQQILQERNV